ncbi:MAG: hypothetical protein GWN86_15840, partial [Desulfobacterales bacterium]|nr:hypothetical protein [Desulfobacterales bacterium]
TTAVQLEEFKIPIVITGGIPKDWKLETYAARQFAVHFQRGDRIVLSGKADGTEEIEIHPGLEIRIIHPNGTIAGRVIPGGTWDPEIDLDKLDLTSMFAVGKNEVFITLYRSLPDLEP